MEMKTPGTIAAAAGLSAAAAWLVSNRVSLKMAPGPVLAVQKTSEVARVPMRGGLVAVGALALGWLAVSQLRKTRESASSSSFVEQTVEVNVPVSTAYNQWTQFEEFPRFMESVHEVKQIDDQHLHWRATIAGQLKEWDSEITEQLPDQRIAWCSTSGPKNSGAVTFEKIGENKTRIKLQMEYEPESTGEKIGDALGGVKLTAKSNLKKFKSLIEQQGVETGAWRGTVAQH